MILGSKRKPCATTPNGVETWLDWVRRTTREAEMRLAKLNIDDWIIIQRKQKLDWARKLATEENQTWASRILDWQPDPCKFGRLQARPRRRWVDDMIEIVLSKLDEMGVLSNTFVLFSSDHGYKLGEWRVGCWPGMLVAGR